MKRRIPQNALTGWSTEAELVLCYLRNEFSYIIRLNFSIEVLKISWDINSMNMLYNATLLTE